jgi:hypothetical protein
LISRSERRFFRRKFYQNWFLNFHLDKCVTICCLFAVDVEVLTCTWKKFRLLERHLSWGAKRRRESFLNLILSVLEEKLFLLMIFHMSSAWEVCGNFICFEFNLSLSFRICAMATNGIDDVRKWKTTFWSGYAFVLRLTLIWSSLTEVKWVFDFGWIELSLLSSENLREIYRKFSFCFCFRSHFASLLNKQIYCFRVVFKTAFNLVVLFEKISWETWQNCQ